MLVGDHWDLHYYVCFVAEGHRVTPGMCEVGANRAIGSCRRRLPTLHVGVLLICLSLSTASSSCSRGNTE